MGSPCCILLGRFSGQSARLWFREIETKRERDEGGGSKCLQMGSLTLVLFFLTGAPHMKILTKLDPNVLSCYIMTLYYVETLQSQSRIKEKQNVDPLHIGMTYTTHWLRSQSFPSLSNVCLFWRM